MQSNITTQYNIIQCNTIQYNTIQYNTTKQLRSFLGFFNFFRTMQYNTTDWMKLKTYNKIEYIILYIIYII